MSTHEGEDCEPVWLFCHLTVLLQISQGRTKECAGKKHPPHHWFPLLSLTSQTARKKALVNVFSFSYSGGQKGSNSKRVAFLQLTNDCRCRSYPGPSLVSPLCLITVGFMNKTLKGDIHEDCACYLNKDFFKHKTNCICHSTKQHKGTC